jgi:hypothetical protein
MRGFRVTEIFPDELRNLHRQSIIHRDSNTKVHCQAEGNAPVASILVVVLLRLESREDLPAPGALLARGRRWWRRRRLRKAVMLRRPNYYHRCRRRRRPTRRSVRVSRILLDRLLGCVRRGRVWNAGPVGMRAVFFVALVRVVWR